MTRYCLSSRSADTNLSSAATQPFILVMRGSRVMALDSPIDWRLQLRSVKFRPVFMKLPSSLNPRQVACYKSRVFLKAI